MSLFSKKESKTENSNEKTEVSGKGKNGSIFTKETFGVCLCLFSTLCLICIISRDKVFSTPGLYISSFLFGCFGYFAFLVTIACFLLGFSLIFDKKIKAPLKQKVLFSVSLLLLVILINQLTMASYSDLSFGEYISKSYELGSGGLKTCSGGGFFISIISYGLLKILTNVGCYSVLGILFFASTYFLIKDIRKNLPKKTNEVKGSFSENVSNSENTTEEEKGEEQEVKQNKPSVNLFVNNAGSFNLKTKKELKNEARANGYTSTSTPSYSKSFSNEMKEKIDYVKTPPQIDFEKLNAQKDESKNVFKDTSISKVIENKRSANDKKDIPLFMHDENNDITKKHAENFFDKYIEPEVNDVPLTEVKDEQSPKKFNSREGFINRNVNKFTSELNLDDNKISDNFNESDFVNKDKEIIEENYDEEIRSNIIDNSEIKDIFSGSVEQQSKSFEREKTERLSLNLIEEKEVENKGVEKPNNIIEETPVEKKEEKKFVPINRPYNRPPLDLLADLRTNVVTHNEDHEKRKEIIKRTLSDFHIEVEPQGYIQGPSITRYEITMPAGIPVRKVLNYDDDLKMRLAVKDGVRIEAPIPGKDLVGIEVANEVKTPVGLREVLEGMAKKTFKKNSLMFAIGKNIVGEAICDDLSKGPHYLVAGATGSGKSVCLNVMIVSLIMRYTPEDLRFILIDPKRVEFRKYESLPHMLIPETITEPQKALNVLTWAYEEMERRYKLFEESSGMVNDINSYNEYVASDTVAKMPRIVIIIDELADLMENCKKEFENRIRALAQKARSAGIHLVLATQRPSVDIITGTIKANLPARIALKVMNFNDSQTILSQAGAEKLLGNGDMLYKTSEMPDFERYQGAYISNREICDIVKYIKDNNQAYFDDELINYLDKVSQPKQEETSVDSDDDNDSSEDLFVKVLAHAVMIGTVSISMLQRSFGIGFNKAGRLVLKMEKCGYITGYDGAKPRKVLLTKEEFEKMYGNLGDVE